MKVSSNLNKIYPVTVLLTFANMVSSEPVVAKSITIPGAIAPILTPGFDDVLYRTRSVTKLFVAWIRPTNEHARRMINRNIVVPLIRTLFYLVSTCSTNVM